MEHKHEKHENGGPEVEFILDIEGTKHKWHKETITVIEVRELAKIPHDQRLVCEDEHGCERTIEETEIIIIKPGHRHGRAPKYKRG